jgi:hypothetical protein
MFADLIRTETHSIRGKEFVFSEYGTDQYLAHIAADDDTQKASSREIVEHNIKFASQVVALSLAPNSEFSADEIIKEFMQAPRALQDELFDKAAALNGITLVKEATKGNESPDSGLPES